MRLSKQTNPNINFPQDFCEPSTNSSKATLDSLRFGSLKKKKKKMPRFSHVLTESSAGKKSERLLGSTSNQFECSQPVLLTRISLTTQKLEAPRGGVNYINGYRYRC